MTGSVESCRKRGFCPRMLSCNRSRLSDIAIHKPLQLAALLSKLKSLNNEVVMSDRPYLFYELTNSLCATCLRKVEAKVVIQDHNVYMHKWCPDHRFQKVLI